MAYPDRRTVCFIDDDPAELSRFDKAFGKDFNVICASTYTEAAEKLKKAGRRSPHLWVLDLYFPTLSHSNTPEELHEMSARFEEFDRAKRDFVSYLDSINQGREGGIQLLGQCRQHHRAPVVMFTRKGTIDDAIACLSAGAADVLKKPMPPKLPSEEAQRAQALDEALFQAKASLKDRFATHIAQNTHWAKNNARYLAIATFVLGIFVDRALGWIGF